MIKLDNECGLVAILNDKFVATANADGTWKITSENVSLRIDDGVYVRGNLTIPKAQINITAIPASDNPDETLWEMEVFL